MAQTKSKSGKTSPIIGIALAMIAGLVFFGFVSSGGTLKKFETESQYILKFVNSRDCTSESLKLVCDLGKFITVDIKEELDKKRPGKRELSFGMIINYSDEKSLGSILDSEEGARALELLKRYKADRQFIIKCATIPKSNVQMIGKGATGCMNNQFSDPFLVIARARKL